MMTRIQNKLMLYFIILVLLMSAVSLWIYVSSQKSIQQYDDILQRFIVLNEVSQRTRLLNESLEQYTLRPSEQYLQKFALHKAALMDTRERLPTVLDETEDRYLLKNYYHMIDYMAQNMDEMIHFFSQGDMHQYVYQQNEYRQLLSLVTSMSLELIHSELTSYHEFYSEVIARNRYYHSFGASASAVFLILSIGFTYFFSKGITRPLRRLAMRARQISRGHFEGHPVPVTTRDEIGLLTETFNTMQRNIQELVAEMKQKVVLERKLQEQTIKGLEMDRLLKEMELKTLQNQINPHFLFNTLNTLSKMAYIEGADKTSEFIVTVSNVFRYNLKRLDQAVTLEDELNHAQDYVEIQKMRFGERIDFRTDVDPSCLEQKVPFLTIQPFIENVFKHAINSLTDTAIIELKVYPTLAGVVVEVKDNGIGMDETVQDDIQSTPYVAANQEKSSHTGSSTGIGIRNVVGRLRLFYQCEDVIEVHSKPRQGTTIRLLLPRRS